MSQKILQILVLIKYQHLLPSVYSTLFFFDKTVCVCVCVKLYMYNECLSIVICLSECTGCGTAVHGRWPTLSQPNNTSKPTVTFRQMETTWCPAVTALEARAVKLRWDQWRCLYRGGVPYRCGCTDDGGSLLVTYFHRIDWVKITQTFTGINNAFCNMSSGKIHNWI